jgi:hypothetical protein
MATPPKTNTPMARAFLDHYDAKRQKKRREGAAPTPPADTNFSGEFNEEFA